MGDRSKQEEFLMGVGLDTPATLNSDDSITKQTRLYGLIAEEATQHRLFVLLNRIIKPEAMMIPMNIRRDDFYYTVANLKHSKVDGAYIASEYQEEVLELLDEQDEFVKAYGRCDFVVREGQRLHGYLTQTNDVASLEELANIIATRLIRMEDDK